MNSECFDGPEGLPIATTSMFSQDTSVVPGRVKCTSLVIAGLEETNNYFSVSPLRWSEVSSVSNDRMFKSRITDRDERAIGGKPCGVMALERAFHFCYRGSAAGVLAP